MFNSDVSTCSIILYSLLWLIAFAFFFFLLRLIHIDNLFCFRFRFRLVWMAPDERKTGESLEVE